MEKITDEIIKHVTDHYGYDRELFDKLVDAFDMGDDGCFTVRDENQNICAFNFIGHTNFIYYDHVLKAALVSCLGVTKFGDTKDMFMMLKEPKKFKYTKTDVIICEAASEQFERLYTRFTDGVLIGGNCQENIAQEETLTYPKNHDVSLRILTVDEFYPLYEQWTLRLVSDNDPDVSGYYTISEGVATYTKEPVDGAEQMTHKELNRLLIPHSNCCFFF